MEYLIKPKLRDNIEIHTSDSGILLRDLDADRTFAIGKLEAQLLKSFTGESTIDELKEKNKQLIDSRNLEKFILLMAESGLLDKENIERKKFNIKEIRFPLFKINNIFKRGRILNILVYSIFILAIVSLLLLIKVIESNGIGILQAVLENDYLRIENVLYYFISACIIGFFHELSHGITIINFGGNVFEIGFMLNSFQPAFYVDITGVNRLRSKGQRMLVWIAGVAIQLVILTPCIYLGFTLNSILYLNKFLIIFNLLNAAMIIFNMLFVINLDGYYLLCEVLNIKNLREKSIDYIENIFNKDQVNRSTKEKLIYIIMGVITKVYMPVFLISAIVFVVNNFFPERSHIVSVIMLINIGITILVTGIRKIYSYVKGNKA